MICTFQSEVLYAVVFFSSILCNIFHRLVNFSVDVQYIHF